jgi:hypothetical protein
VWFSSDSWWEHGGRVGRLCLAKVKRIGATAPVAPSQAMKRLVQAPNAAVATLWCDMLRQGGIDASVQRYFASGIAGEIPPDQALPEVWVLDDDDIPRARTLLHELRHPPFRRWLCEGCSELVEGPFEQCWNCGAMRPAGPGE